MLRGLTQGSTSLRRPATRPAGGDDCLCTHRHTHIQTRKPWVSVLSICLTPSVREWLDANRRVWSCLPLRGMRTDVSHGGSCRGLLSFTGVDSPVDWDKVIAENPKECLWPSPKGTAALEVRFWISESRPRCAYSPSPVKHTHSTGLTWVTAVELPPFSPPAITQYLPSCWLQWLCSCRMFFTSPLLQEISTHI